MAIEAAIAMNRFGFGATAGEQAPAKPQDWLLEQLDKYDPNPAPIAASPDRAALSDQLAQVYQHRKEFREAKAKGDVSTVPPQFRPIAIRKTYNNAVDYRLRAAASSTASFPERLVSFWSNHFAVSVDNPQVMQFAGDYEFSAIRPHIMGNFPELLAAAETHPAMLFFLNQTRSIGPHSQMASFAERRGRKKFGLNENLGRETMELHTLGVRTVYTQADVIEMSKAYTGLTVAGVPGSFTRLMRNLDTTPGETIFVDQMHEPGTRTVIGKKYPQRGREQIAAILQDLGTHPATAHHVSFQLARHFVADEPPAPLVERMAADFMRTGGNLPSLYKVMVTSHEAWEQPFSKFKSPWEWVVSAVRLVGPDWVPTARDGKAHVTAMLTQLGQAIWKPGSPAGFGDIEQDWAGSGALMQRVNMADRLSRRVGNQVDARALAEAALPGVLSDHTRESIARAADPAQGLALLLLSPEFLRR